MFTCLPRLVVLLLASLAVGCTQGSTVHVVKKFSPGEILLTSADVRSINRTKVTYARGRIIPDQITCAEPSPDIAKAVSESFNFGGSFGISGLPSGISPEVAAAISLARAEGLAQLTQRLATIQLLRDGLYRACEAYANGAMSDTTYAVMLSRFDDTMVTMLMGELAAGNFSGRLAAIGTGAGGGSSASLSEAVRELIDNAKKITNTVEPETPQSGEDGPTQGTQTVSQSSESSRNAAKAAFANSLAQVTQIVAAESSGFRQDPEIAKTIGRMQRKFIENVNLDAMVVACLNALDTGRLDGKPEETWAKLEVAKTAYELDPKNDTLKAIYEDAASFHAQMMADGVKSPLALVCETRILPDVAEYNRMILDHILQVSRAEKEALLKKNALFVHANAVYDSLEFIKLRELGLGDLETDHQALKAEIKVLRPQAENARAAADRQQLVLNDLASKADEARRKALQVGAAASHALSVLAVRKVSLDQAMASWQAAENQALADEKAAVDEPEDAAAKEKAKRSRGNATSRMKERDIAKADSDAATAVANKLKGDLLQATQEAEIAAAGVDQPRKEWERLNLEADRLQANLNRLKAERSSKVSSR